MVHAAESGRPRPGDRPDSPLSWVAALASAKPGRHYRIGEILFDAVRERCAELGYAEGDEIICMENDRRGVCVVGDDDTWRILDRHYARFVRVEPVVRGTWPPGRFASPPSRGGAK